MNNKTKIVGPFTQIITMRNLALRGPLKNSQLEIVLNAGLVVQNGKIIAVDKYKELIDKYNQGDTDIEEMTEPLVLLPGFVDPHTHICWAGSRADDFAKRLEGFSYLEIAEQGGGIWSTVKHTREATESDLQIRTRSRATALLHNGTTTIEIKSGYGLNIESELKMLRAIKEADKHVASDLIPTCLAAHTMPKDYNGSKKEYLAEIIQDLLPVIVDEDLCKRIDIYIEPNTFSSDDARAYLLKAKELGFDLVVHADQFTTGGSLLAVELGAVSADHLEVSKDTEINLLAKSDTISMALPGSSISLAEPFAPARKLLDSGACLAIGSDWNPGSAPMGDILIEASILGVYEKLSMAEILAAITFRSAAALKLNDRGVLGNGKIADFVAFPITDYRDILYYQGRIKPSKIWKNGQLVYKKSWV